MEVRCPCYIIFYTSASARNSKASILSSADLESNLAHPSPPKYPTLPMPFFRMKFYPSPPASPVQDTSPHIIQQDPHKRKREESTEEPRVKRQRTGRRHSWPRHWYNAEGKIPCQAQGCDKVFNDDRKGDQRRISHVTGTTGAEHKIIRYMDRQFGCVHCNYRVVFRERRQLFSHEETAHGNSSMSTLTGFINLARRGEVIGDLGTRAAQPIFDRMLRNLYNLYPSAPRLLYYRVHQRETDNVDEYDLTKILAPDWTGPDDGTLPGTTLVHPDHFLSHLRPNRLRPTWEERWWFRVWKTLRDMYSDGVI